MIELTPQEQMQMYFEDACIRLGISMSLPEVSLLPERNQKAILAYYKLSVIIQCVNEDWEPNWQRWDERKYYPWFDVLPAGLGCSSTYNTASYTYAYFGSRLCYKSSDLAREWGKKLLPLYEDLLLLN